MSLVITLFQSSFNKRREDLESLFGYSSWQARSFNEASVQTKRGKWENLIVGSYSEVFLFK